MPFNNGVLSVSSDEIRVIPYNEFKGLIWRNSIKQREFKRLTNEQIDESEISQFLSLVTLRDNYESGGATHINKFIWLKHLFWAPGTYFIG